MAPLVPTREGRTFLQAGPTGPDFGVDPRNQTHRDQHADYGGLRDESEDVDDSRVEEVDDALQALVGHFVNRVGLAGGHGVRERAREGSGRGRDRGDDDGGSRGAEGEQLLELGVHALGF